MTEADGIPPPPAPAPAARGSPHSPPQGLAAAGGLGDRPSASAREGPSEDCMVEEFEIEVHPQIEAALERARRTEHLKSRSIPSGGSGQRTR
eukprot:15437769-Alexandrium_andersonii.AAC.1